MIQWNGQQVIDDVEQRIKANMLAMAQQVVNVAERLAPKKTGALALGLGFDWNESTYTVVFTAQEPYSMFQEYGTRNMNAHPYFRPALNSVGPQFGFNFEFSFTSTIATDTKLLAHGSTFQMHQSLTDKQKAHVRANLKPASKWQWEEQSGNVARAKVHARRIQF